MPNTVPVLRKQLLAGQTSSLPLKGCHSSEGVCFLKARQMKKSPQIV